jgi:hypothetical protein
METSVSMTNKVANNSDVDSDLGKTKVPLH